MSTTTSTHTPFSSTLPKLATDGSNWLVWKSRMQTFVGVRKLAHHLDSLTIPPAKPEPLAKEADKAAIENHEKETEKYDEWMQGDIEVKHYIHATIPDSLHIQTINCASSKEIWETICKEHENKTQIFRMEMSRRIYSQRCTEAEDIRNHFAYMLRLREELAATGEILPEANFTSLLCNSLPPSYGNVITSAFSSAAINNTLPTTQQIISIVQTEQSRRQIAEGGIPGSSTSVALYTNPKGPSASKRGKKKPNRCTNTKCKYRHTHDFKDCRSEGGPQHASNPLPVRNTQNSNQGQNRPQNQNGQGGRNAGQMMRANVAQEATQPAEPTEINLALSSSTSIGIAGIAANGDPLERLEVYDSGATCHMSPYIDAFIDFEFITPKPICAANNQIFQAVGKGDMQVKIPNGDSFTSATLHDVLYAPDIAFTLISLTHVDKAGYSTLIEGGELHLIDRSTRTIVGRIPSHNDLWSVRPTKALENGNQHLLPGNCSLITISIMDLHRCLGHISPSTAAQLVNKGSLPGITINDWNVDFCEVCALSKIKRQPFPKHRAHPAQDVGDVIHSDVWGPATVQAIGGESYAVTWIDEGTRYGVVEGMRAKSDTFAEYKAYEAWLRVQRGKNIKCLQTDRGGEYMSTEFVNHLRQQGTTRQLTVHDSPQSNGIAERCNGVLLNHVRALLADSGLPKFLWKEALKFAMWIRNRTTTHQLDGKTPYEAFHGVKPDVGEIHLWGSRVWVRDLTAGKLDPRGREGRFVGYDAESKGCRIYWPNSRSIGVERDLIFEDRPVNSELITLPEPFPVRNKRPKPTATTPPEIPKSHDAQPPEADPDSANQPTPSVDITAAPPDLVPDEDQSDAAEAESINPRSKRIRKPSPLLRDLLEGKSDGGTARGKSRIPKGVQLPTGMTATQDDLELELECDITACFAHESQVIEVAMASAPDTGIADDDPKNLAEAMERSDWPEWKKAMDEEIALMAKYDVWDEVDHPDDANLVGCRWVFRIKRDSDGKILKYRARLVAQGFTQLYGVDFNETFAPVARLSSLRTVIAIAASEDWELHQMDVKSAYLNSPIDTAIYMRLPPGYTSKGKVARVKKGLYGLRQSGNLWHKTLAIAFQQLDLIRSAVDHGVFYVHDNEGTTIVCSSTDDFAITASSPSRMEKFKSNLSNHFEMSDLGELAWILGIRVTRDRTLRTISLSQSAYIDSVVKRFNLTSAAPLGTPLDPSIQLSKDQSPSTTQHWEDMQKVPYREAIGSLMYAAIGTRPDITYAVTALSQYLQNPGRAHWEQAKRVIRYLKGTRDHELKFGSSGGVEGFSDANWGNDIDDRHSICGYAFTLNGGAISWSSKKQSVVALSSTEAEYIAITHAAKEATWVRHLLSELYSPLVLNYPIILYSDNKSAIELVKNATFHSRTKHIAIRYHYVCEAYNDGVIFLDHRGTEDMPADVFTKPLIRIKLNKFARLLGLSQT